MSLKLRQAKACRTSLNLSHTNTFGFAYANDIANTSFAAKPPAPFGLGSIIVREKLLALAAPTPHVLVVMIKGEKGSNPKANDWEFLTVSGDLTKVEQRDKEGKCQKCHASEAKNDFIFRYPTR